MSRFDSGARFSCSPFRSNSQSLNFGRPYSLPLHFIQCPQPAVAAPPSSADTFHTLKFDLGLLFGKVADLLAAPDLPPYEKVLQLDQELRAREACAPPWLRLGSGAPPHADATTVPQKHMVSLLLHKALLGAHYVWIWHSVNLTDPLRSPSSTVVREGDLVGPRADAQ